MKVGIVVVNYNNAQDTLDCVESLLTTDYTNKFLYIIDNGSAPADRIMLETKLRGLQGFETVGIFVQLEDNLGFSGGYNHGMRMALENNCNAVLIINNDTIVDKSFLKEMVQELENDKNVAVVGGKIFFHEAPDVLWTVGGRVKKYSLGSEYYGHNQKDHGQFDDLEISHVSGCLALYSSEILRKVGLLDEEFFFRGEEWDHCYRLQAAGYKAKLAKDAKIYHRVSRTVKRFSRFDIYCAYRAKLLFARKHLNRLFFYAVYPLIFAVIIQKFFFYKNLSRKRNNNFMSWREYISLIIVVLLDDIRKIPMKKTAERFLTWQK